jgi:RHH-type proline utilization regulon transcriptional repressor/proline dehydrogenase/delta 1-pyrroline-5-carboxylate dehydrogenase
MASPYEDGIRRAGELCAAARALTSDEPLPGMTVELARVLLETSHAGAEPNERERAARLAALLHDPIGQAFVSALTDRAHRSSSGARLVAEVKALVSALGAPGSLPAWDRLQLRALQAFGTTVPELTARAVRHRIYQDAAPYLAPAEPKALGAFLHERALMGLRVNVNHLGEEVLGDDAAAHYLASYLGLLARSEVSTISVKLSSIDARIDVIAWEKTLERLEQKLTLVYRAALAGTEARDGEAKAPKLVYLDMEAYRDLGLTVELFTRVLDKPEFRQLTAGIVLQAYLPDSHRYQRALLDWARERVKLGGAPVRLRLVKGANLMLERIESSSRGLELPVYGTKAEVDASFRRMLLHGSRPEHAAAVRLGVGSHNLFDIAYTLLLRERRGVQDAIEPEMLEGMADPLRRVVQRVTGKVLVYAPSVDERDFASAVAYLVRRLDENTAEDNFLRRSFSMHAGDAAFESEKARFVQALAHVERVDTVSRRTQDRTAAVETPARSRFVNDPDTDYSRDVNRAWLARALADALAAQREPVLSIVDGEPRGGEEHDGFDPSRPGVVPYRWAALDRAGVEHAIGVAHAAQKDWAGRPAEEREALLLAVAGELRRARGELLGLMVLDGGKRALEADLELAEAIDFAAYYARQHARLRERFTLEPKGVVVVTPPWNFPLSIGLGGALSALVAGNTVLLKPSPETPLVLSRAVALCHKAGIPASALALVLSEDAAAEPLVVDRRVSTVVLTGGSETARLFRRLRPGLDLVAETGGKNTLIVSAMSDREQAVQNIVRSAFGHAGQKCSALSLLVLEREVYRSAAFRHKLEDAVRTLPVGSAWELENVVTPLIRPPEGALERALSTLDDGERWLVEPTRSADNPRLVGPGVRWGVAPGSFAHQTELFGPVLSVIEAADFEHALELANGTPYGLTAGLESLDESEHARFLTRMQAGNLYVNRTITGAIVGRQPFGGHKASSFGPGFKAGGPNTILALARVVNERTPRTFFGVLSRGPRAEARPAVPQRALPAPDHGSLAGVIADTLRDATRPEQERLARRLKSYEVAAREELEPEHQQDQVLGFSDQLVYRPAHVLLVVPKSASELDLLSALLAAQLARAKVEVVAEHRVASARFERLVPAEAAGWYATAGELERRIAGRSFDRVRVLGPSTGPAYEAAKALEAASPSLETEPVHDAGYVEVRRFALEQSRSVARHRHGNMSLVAAVERLKQT